MKTIDTLISELVEIGKKYPKKPNGVLFFFKNHTNQSQAQYLQELETIHSSQATMEQKIEAVQDIIRKIYKELKVEGTLIKKIHQCIMKAENRDFFPSYTEQRDQIIARITENNADIARYNDGGGNIGSRTISPEMSFHISEYRDMADVTIPCERDLTPTLFNRGQSVEIELLPLKYKP